MDTEEIDEALHFAHSEAGVPLLTKETMAEEYHVFSCSIAA